LNLATNSTESFPIVSDAPQSVLAILRIAALQSPSKAELPACIFLPSNTDAPGGRLRLERIKGDLQSAGVARGDDLTVGDDACVEASAGNRQARDSDLGIAAVRQGHILVAGRADDTAVKGHAGGAGGQNKRSPVHGEGEGLGGVRQHTVAGRKSNRIIPGSAQHAAAESHSRGRAPDWLIDGGGVPAVVTVNNPPEPTVKVALEEPASNGATEGGFTVSVTVLLVTFPTLLLTSTAKDASVSEVLLAAVVYEKDVAPLMATLF